MLILLYRLESALSHATKVLFALTMLMFAVGIVVQSMLLVARFGGVAIGVLAAFAGISTIAVIASASMDRREEHRKAVKGLPPMRHWVVDPEAQGGLREVASRRLGEG